MQYREHHFVKLLLALFLPFALFFLLAAEGQAAKREVYDIIYLRTKDFDKILDYKEELETVFDAEIRNKLKIVGLGGGEYALIYDGNLSAGTVDTGS